MSALSHEAANHALERAVHYLDHHSFRIRGQGSYCKSLSISARMPVDFVVGNRCGLALERNDVHHAGAFQYGERIIVGSKRAKQ